MKKNTMRNGGNMEKTIKMTYDEWVAALDKLVNCGEEFYEFYADIEDALDRYDSRQIEITLNGSENSFRIFENRAE